MDSLDRDCRAGWESNARQPLIAAEVANASAVMIANSQMQVPATTRAVPNLNIALAWSIADWSSRTEPSITKSAFASCYGPERLCPSVVRACFAYAMISASVIADVLTSACRTILA